MQEEWRVCVINKNYEISNLGRLRNLVTKRIIKLYCHSNGYASYSTRHEGKKIAISIHQAVAKTFLGPRPKGCVIDHIDNNRSNNRVDNLRYVSYSENGKNSRKFKKAPIVVSVEGLDELIQEFESCDEARDIIGSYRGTAVTPTMKNGVWSCKTYE